MKSIFTFTLALLLSGFMNAQTDVVTGLNSPSRLLLHGNDLYFSDLNSVQKIDITQTSTTPVTVLSGLAGPLGMAIIGNDLYVAIFDGGKIIKADISQPSPTAVDVVTGLDTPNGLLVIGTDLYYSDNNSQKIAKIDLTQPTPTVQNVMTGLQGPIGMASSGNFLYFGQTLNNRISKIDYTTSPVLATVATGVIRPLGIRIVGNYVYIAELNGNKVSRKDVTTASVVAESVVASLNQPSDIELNATTLFICEKGANKISKIANVLGVNQFGFAKDMVLYPNPAQYVIHLSNLSDSASYKIYSVVGAEILTGETAPGQGIDVSKLASGIYLMSVNDAPAVRFIKE